MRYIFIIALMIGTLQANITGKDVVMCKAYADNTVIIIKEIIDKQNMSEIVNSRLNKDGSLDDAVFKQIDNAFTISLLMGQKNETLAVQEIQRQYLKCVRDSK